MTERSLPPIDVRGRLDRLRARMDAAACDALIITHQTNVRYLTGFTGSAGFLIVDAEGALLVTDGRYEEQAADQLGASGADAGIEICHVVELQREVAAGRLSGRNHIGLESGHVSWAEQRRYDEEWFPTAELVATVDLVEELRAVKDAAEVARIAAACSIADDALAAALRELKDRPTEVSFAQLLDSEMRSGGADDVSFRTIVASGPNGSRPHHEPGGRRIEPGDLLVVDFGALVDGYHSDMTRTIPVGGRAGLDKTQRRMIDVVTAAQAAGVEAVRAGGKASDVDAACRGVIEEAGWGDAFVHGTGHGVGLDIHEAPGINARSTATLAVGHVVTVEPGVYLPGHGGVRVEDTVVVTEDGRRSLTCAPKP